MRVLRCGRREWWLETGPGMVRPFLNIPLREPSRSWVTPDPDGMAWVLSTGVFAGRIYNYATTGSRKVALEFRNMGADG